MQAVETKRMALLTRGQLRAAVCALLFSAPAHAYRTGQDSPGLEGRVAWAEREVGFYLVDEGLPGGVTRDVAEQVVQASLEAWDAIECGHVRPFFAGLDASADGWAQHDCLGE
jgi:hypothetical protein